VVDCLKTTHDISKAYLGKGEERNTMKLKTGKNLRMLRRRHGNGTRKAMLKEKEGVPGRRNGFFER